MHELSRTLRIPYASFYRTIQEMTGLLIIKKVGKAKTLKLNLKSQTIHSYLTISSEQEKEEFIKNKPLIKIIEKDLDTKDIVLLFGSYAKGTETKRSDIDMIIINKKGEKSISFSKHETLFDKEINPMFFKEKEFILMLRDKEENVGKQALKSHVVLNNPKRFWEVVLDAI
ncbi:nucleotidyltransferase domain-containing protein [Candidatus Woesearchaeota archaeon]|nr:nucleotidyltransferase domain-containing protein [Candidatus Woesearchaeota archaeon]